MSDAAIKVENLSKKYYLGTAASGNLRDTLAMGWNRLRGKASATDKKEFWALQDVSFEVKKGEVIGVIGRNGAGKSTLLKILSRITEPTSGRIILNGRVASLLEVGTGFHPELSGRENIYLNGALLGMTRAEIKRKFDEIIDFSGVEEFIDTPVKKYSSGMYVRLAFAVAAHLEPEILLVDEVLAVGDAEFQKKCLGKMGEVARGGKTVIFVSHDMRTISNLCEKSILMEAGKIKQFGNSTEVIDAYLNQFSNDYKSEKNHQESSKIPINSNQFIESASIFFEQSSNQVLLIQNGKPLNFHINISIKKEIIGFRAELEFCNFQGIILIKSLIDEEEERGLTFSKGHHKISISVPSNLFIGGQSYFIRLRLNIYDSISFLANEGHIIPFQVEETGKFNRKQFSNYYKGFLTLDSITWQIQSSNK